MTDDPSTGTDRVEVLDERRTNRWIGLSGATLAGAAIALLARSAGLLLVAGLGATLVAYARVASPPTVAIALDRQFDPVDPGVGEPVTVELTIANVGDRTITDLRLADGVPEGTAVTGGAATIATALRPGAATTLQYEIGGDHARRTFSPATVAVRDVAGLVERRARVDAGIDTLAWPSLRPASALRLLPPSFAPVGPLATDEGGEGLAFHSVREYRPGDPRSRVDWRRRAKTGELATVEFRRERVATVVVIVDARPAADLAPGEESASAIERSTAAAGALLEGVEAAGHRVGLAALGPEPCWIPPGRGRDHRERLHRQLATAGGFTARAGRDSDEQESATGAESVDEGGSRVRTGATTDGAADAGARADTATDEAAESGPRNDTATDGSGDDLAAVLARLDGDASVVLLSPLCDDGSDRISRQLAARTRSLSILSPDPTATETAGQRLVALERAERLQSLRATGLHVVDWPAGASLEHLLAGMEGRP